MGDIFKESWPAHPPDVCSEILPAIPVTIFLDCSIADFSTSSVPSVPLYCTGKSF
jgi:hypothetical protein